MQITVFGATGMLGKHIVKQANWLGIKVIAFGRNADVVYVDEANELLVPVKGYLTDNKAIKKAMEGSQGVCSALGGAMDGQDNTRSLGMKNIVAAMQELNLAFISAVGGMGILPADEGKLIYETKDFPEALVPVSIEHLAAYHSLLATKLSFAFFCPPSILDTPFNGNYATANEAVPNNNFTIDGGNLANAMIEHIKNKQQLQARVGIANI
jgi:uncharacterized protein